MAHVLGKLSETACACDQAVLTLPGAQQTAGQSMPADRAHLSRGMSDALALAQLLQQDAAPDTTAQEFAELAAAQAAASAAASAQLQESFAQTMELMVRILEPAASQAAADGGNQPALQASGGAVLHVAVPASTPSQAAELLEVRSLLRMHAVHVLACE